MTRADELMAKVLHRTLKPKTKLNTHEWSKKHVRLDARFTARPGFYDVGFTPYMRGPHEWFSDPRVTEMTGCKSRQVGGTTLLANCMMYAVGEDPGPILYVTSTGTNAQSFSEREWIPRVDLSPLLSSLKPDNPDDFKKVEQHFKTCTAKFVGSNSPANLMSRAIRYLFEDEIDTWPEDNGAEAPSIEIVEACTLSYGHTKKILRISTPTVETGAIWQNYLRGSQHKYHVPCPHCEHKFELLFEHLNFHRDECRTEEGVWDLDKLVRLTSLTCPSCKGDIDQVDQSLMVDKGIWVQTNMGAPRNHISWHISALYSPTVTWGDVAKAFIQKHETPGGLHDFYNHYLGLPFQRKSTTVTISDIEAVRDASPEYRSYSGPGWISPAEFELIVMAVDVQADGFWWGQRGLCLDESSYLIDYGPASSWADLIDLFDRTYTNPSGRIIPVYKSLMDSGFMARRIAGVYDFCFSSGGRFMPVQGRSVQHGLFAPIRETQFDHKGTLIDAVQLRDDLFKEELYIRRIKERQGAGWFLPRNLDEVYKKQLTDEKLMPKKTARGTEIMEWKDFGNNHMGDVEKYLLGAINLVVAYLRELRENQGKIAEPSEEMKERIRELTTPPDERIPRTPRESLERRAIDARDNLELN
jgi:phage terminase large subunit GpA-like protein